MEIEIKLTVDAAAPGGPGKVLDALAAATAVAGHPLGPVTAVSIVDTYFDTPDGALGAARVAIRLRRLGDASLVTVKQGKQHSGALAVREETEAPLTSDSLARVLAPLVAVGLLPAARVSCADFAAGRPCGPLVPILTARTWRRQRAMVSPAVLLCLDVVEYAGLNAPLFHDIEVESAGAPIAELQRLATSIQAATGGYAQPAPTSKLARGLRLLGDK